MRKLMMFSTLLFFFVPAFAEPVLNQSDVEVNEPALVEKLYHAYVDEGEPQADGSFIFAYALKCEKTRCWLLKGHWLAATEPSFVKGVLYTPAKEELAIDLAEYMKIQPLIEQVEGYTVRKKTLEAKANQKYYALNCVSTQFDATGELLSVQCAFYNGLQE